MSGVQIETISDEADLAQLAGDWDELVRSMPRPSPFLLHGWVLEWWRQYGARRRLTVYVARRGDRLVGALPVCRTRRLGLRVTEFLGGKGAQLADLMLAPGEEPETAGRLAALLGGSGHDFADLFGLPGRSRLVGALPTGSLSLLQRLEAPVLDLRDGRDEIARRHSSKARRNRARRLRQLGQLGAVRVSVARSPGEVAVQLEEAFRVHELRWRGRRDASGFGTPEGRAFHRAAVRRLADDDVARLVTVRVGERPVAFTLSLLLERTLYGVAMGFDPAFARYSPGTETLLSALESAADEGAERVELLGAASPYKRRLTDRLEPVHEGIGLPSTLRGRAAAGLLVAGIRTRRRLKRSETARRLYEQAFRPHTAPVRAAGVHSRDVPRIDEEVLS